jgi:ParB-like chromosome segregation protein Spo0J
MNARTHSDEQVDQIAASIREFGFTNNILIDENGTIIAGHGRVLALKKLGETEVPYTIIAGLTEAQRKALILADNKLALNAGWDEELLKIELQSLQDMDFDYSNLGFDFEFDIEEISDNNEINLDNNKEYKEKFMIIIDCDSELQQEEIFYNLTNQGIKCRVQSL